MKSKTEYVTLLSSIIAASFTVMYSKQDGTLLLIKKELNRILDQSDFDNINSIYEHVLDFFSRTDPNMHPEEIEELARITQTSVNMTIGDMMGMELQSLG